MVNAILFDLDDTLLDSFKSMKICLQSQYGRFKEFKKYFSESYYVSQLLYLIRENHISIENSYVILFNEYPIDTLDSLSLIKDFQNYYPKHAIGFADLEIVLTNLKIQGYKLGIISNGIDKIQREKIKVLGIESYFDVIIISEFEKIEKPNTIIFKRAIEQINAILEESVYIGNDPEKDIVGAKNAGMKTIWKRDITWDIEPESDAIVDNLSEIIKVINTL